MKSHKLWGKRIYSIFRGIKYRCEYPSCAKYSRYGGRGIKNTWKTFEEFRDDMYELYLIHVAEFGEKNTEIDRIDNNGNYSKENCRWVTHKEQMKNRSNTIYHTFKGKTKTLNEWSSELGISKESITNRIKNLGWSVHKALSTPIL